MHNKYILGIDTSNYKTSIAVTDNNQSIVCDLRRFLMVKQGERGLRQSDALFQHVKNIPELMESLRDVFDGTFEAIAYSSKPRPLKGSYMPVFLAGESFARTLSATLDLPLVETSHQEGHIEAVKAYSELKNTEKFLACHFSGGTTELLEVISTEKGYDIEIIGGSKDISFGQVIDRAGVLFGMKFPAGEEMDNIAANCTTASNVLTKIKVNDAWLNLSGIDTQIKRHIDNTCTSQSSGIIKEIFEKTADAMSNMIIQGSKKTGINKVLMAGGVSSSKFIRKTLEDKLVRQGITAAFDNSGLSQDNAVGVSLIGGRNIWR